MIKTSTQHDTAGARESCHPGWALPQSLEESAHAMMRHTTVTAGLAASQASCTMGSRSRVWVRGGPGEGVH